MQLQTNLSPQNMLAKIDQLFELAGPKTLALHQSWSPGRGAPVFTLEGQYSTRSWTDWTMGFHIGLAILQFDATDDAEFLKIGQQKTVQVMAPHVSHIGVHDHGFNNISTYGNLRRLMLEGRIPHNQTELDFYELALKISGAVQAARYTELDVDNGYIYSFNGPHSLFADTIRSLRSLILAHRLGHVLMGEADRPINLLKRALSHAEITARYNVYFGEGRDMYDKPGRVAHESIFNTNDGNYRCPNSQQGYSPYTTWSRGAAWIILGYAELLELLEVMEDQELEGYGGREALEALYLRVLRATCDYYINGYTCADGMPFWDSGAPGLVALGEYQHAPSNPLNDHEPIDSSAAAITAQGMLRLGRYLVTGADPAAGRRYLEAGLTVADTLFSEPYLSTDPMHQGLILHGVYHRPNGWDYVPPGQHIPSGESVMWGDYHAVELALLIKRLASGQYFTFLG